MRAAVIVDAARDATSFVKDIVNLYRSDLGIGLVVGVAGIGVVLIRSVRERNRQIGTLRAMGFEARQIGRAFMIEGAFVGLQGVVVGIGLGVLTLISISRTAAMKDLFGYHPPRPGLPISIAVLGATLFVAAVLASVGPARAASRIPPAVALRLVD
jgi:putative ABC transport system permease protein